MPQSNPAFSISVSDQQLSFQLDSHQHVHAVPIVYRALAQALTKENCLVKRLREPIDPLPFTDLRRRRLKGISRFLRASSTQYADANPDG